MVISSLYLLKLKQSLVCIKWPAEQQRVFQIQDEMNKKIFPEYPFLLIVITQSFRICSFKSCLWLIIILLLLSYQQLIQSILITMKNYNPLKQSFQGEHGFSKVALANFGFELCLRSKLLRELYNIKPVGINSCLHDAIITGLENLRGLYQMIDESGNAGSWKLINIIICDGKKDKNSKKSWNEVIQAYQQAKSRIRAYEFRTIIIAYNVTQQEYSELLRFNQLDPQIPVYPSSFYHSEYDDLNLGKLMKRIRNDVGLIFKQPRQSDLFFNKEVEEVDEAANPYAIPEKHFSYGVLFTVSGIQEYGDQIWNSICNNINNFTRYLGDRDILGGILYADSVRYFKEEKFILKEEKKKLIDPPKKVNQYPASTGYVPPPYSPPPPYTLVNHNVVHSAPPPPMPAPSAPKKHPSQPPPNPKGGSHNGINKSLNSHMHSQKDLATQSEILQSKAFSICQSRSKCRCLCGFLITIFALVIIGGSVFLIVR